MDLKLLSILITVLANSILAAYVFLRNPRKIINVSFGIFIFCTALWSLALFVLGVAKDPGVLRFTGHLAFLGGALMACTFLLFAYVFPQIQDEWPPKRTLLWIFVPGLVASVAAFTPFVMKDITFVHGGVRPAYSKPGIWIFALYVIVFTSYGLFLLARKYLTHPGRFEHVQLKYTFWGLVIPISGIVIITLVLPLVGISRFSTPLTPLLTIMTVAAISYAIVRHRLMDLGVVYRNVLIYLGTANLLVFALVAIALAVRPILELPPSSRILFGALFAALAVQPTRRMVESIVDRYFFRGRYNYQAALTEFSISMTRILNLESLQNRIVNEVASILQVKTAGLFLLDPVKEAYTIRCSIPPQFAERGDGIAVDSPVVERMTNEGSLQVRDELRRLLSYAEFVPLATEFERFEAEVLIPLVYRGEMIGILSLGEKSVADIYSEEDLNLLATLGNQTAVALENALLHHTVTVLKNHNENILKYMSSGVIAIDRDKVVTTCNDKARDILNLPAYVIPNRTIDILPLALRSMLSETLEGKTSYSNHEIQILSELGSITYLNASTSLLRDEDNSVTGALLVFTDLTDLKLLESEMWRADKLASLGTLAAGMAHEIKNPLVSIKTFAQLLPTRFEDKDFRDTFASITVDEVERINSIVEKLLEFARPTAPVFEPVDVLAITEEVLLLISAEASKHNVTIIRNFETDSTPIVGDKAQLKQALLNLCLNGLQAISEAEDRSDGELTIAAGFRKRKHRGTGDFSLDEIAQLYYGTEVATSTDDAEMLVIKVSDNGHGISREDLPRIFDPFFTTKKKGMGLGLAVVHGIIKEHSGNITVDSAKGGGTEFIVTLPVTQLFVKERV